MYKNERVLGLIPARGGSKGLPGKNIRPLCGKPLVAYSIEHGANSKIIDRLFVSTDDKEIASIAEQWGVVVPFLRPAELATDISPSIDTVLHTIYYFEKQNEYFDIVILLQPTSPLREPDDIVKAVDLLLKNLDAESVVSISAADENNPAFCVRIQNEFIEPFSDGNFEPKRRQDTEELFFINGTIFIAHINSLKEKQGFFHNKTLGYVVQKWKSFEINDLTDFIIVEALIKAKREGMLK